MKMTPKQAGALKDCYSAYAAALSSYEAGEPESEGKLDEAMKAMKAKHAEFGAEDEIPGTEPTMTGAPAGPAAMPPAAPMATQEMPPAEVAGEYEVTSEEEFTSTPDVAFAKSLRNQNKMLAQLGGLAKRYAVSEKENQLLRTKAALDKFSAELATIAKEREVETDMYISAFQASGADAAEGTKLLAKARSRPVIRTPSREPAIGIRRAAPAPETFSAEDDKAVAGRLEQELGGDFSAAFATLGMKLSG